MMGKYNHHINNNNMKNTVVVHIVASSLQAIAYNMLTLGLKQFREVVQERDGMLTHQSKPYKLEQL